MWKYGGKIGQKLSRRLKLIKKLQYENEELKGSITRPKSHDEKLQDLKQKAKIWDTINRKWTEASLVKISQNVTSPIMTTCNLQSFVTRFGNIAITRPNFNYFGHSHNYGATIRNFILLIGSILHLFSSINKLIYPISRNSHQISYILKVFYNDIGVYFNVCTKIIYMHTYVYNSYNESQN